jgi:hypothetical protein
MIPGMFGGPMMPAPVNGTPQRCAIVQNSDNTVINIIVSDPAVDPAPEGCILVGIANNVDVNFGWIYDPATGQFTDPNPQPPEELSVDPNSPAPEPTA